ncbi:MAG TPA: hypothetical protein VJL80_00170 [Aeromicrobium sp.]|nr:hypothetical protein [Aeromicrobium sp.]HKY56435.1 hypothetical protein [Aeromicrobium sp.]
MRFPWQRKKPDAEQLEKAKQQAAQAKAAAEKDWPKVKEVAGHARALSARNGFAEAIRAAMGGKS